MERAILFHNIISPYKTLLFNDMDDFLSGNFKVFYFTETSVYRDWLIKKEDLHFSYEVLQPGSKLESISIWKLCRQVLRVLRREAADIFFVDEYSSLPYWVVLFYCCIMGKRLVCFVESQEQDRERKMWKERLKTFFLTRCYRVLVAGTKHHDYVQKLGVKEENIVIVGGVGGVDHTIYDTFLQKYANNKELLYQILNLPVRKYFIYVGRFSEEKNIIGFLHIYGQLRPWKKNWGVLLLGTGPQEEEIKCYVTEKRLKNVIFPGFIQQNVLPMYYLVSEMFVLPSVSETWGLVVDEAIALGLPVLISSQCGCVPDIVHDGENGFVFELDDAMSDLSDKMKRVIEHKEILRDMREASLQISKEYSPRESARRIIEGVFDKDLR